jgi:hypothetical protein
VPVRLANWGLAKRNGVAVASGLFAVCGLFSCGGEFWKHSPRDNDDVWLDNRVSEPNLNEESWCSGCKRFMIALVE